MELKEEMVSQETVYQGIIVNVRRDKAKLPDGRLTNREVVEHPGGVAIFAMDDQDRVALVRQYRYPSCPPESWKRARTPETAACGSCGRRRG